MRKCKDCEHFKLICPPMGKYDAGQVECKKHNLIADYVSTQKINNPTCIEEGSEENE